jgi:VWFA-related protein
MRRLLLTVALLLAPAATAQVNEFIEVVRILLDVRVTKADGDPILGLTAEDFDVRIAGNRVTVESVRWVDESAGIEISPRTASVTSTPSEDATEAARLEQKRGRLIVVFIQTDHARETPRVAGQLNFRRHAEALMDSFAPEDRIAVFSFDSHLKFRLDFTSDKDKVKEQIRAAIRTDIPPPPPLVPNPSLASRLNRASMKAAGNSETALLHVGNALRGIEGPKTLLLMGWGLGVRSGGRVHMRPTWKAARNALDASRTTIFAFDTTVADYHDLQVGLMGAAEETGGFYAKTHLFPATAVDRLQRTLAGHYELELRRPAQLKRGTHAVRVSVKDRNAAVMAPQSYTDR